MASISRVVQNLLKSEAGRRQPGKVIMRAIWWQLWRRLLKKPMEFTAATDSRLCLLPGASDSLSAFWYEELPDFDELCFALHILRRGELFVDVGANQGGWSLMAAGREARVIAFEPIPVTRERLVANIANNPPEIRERIRVSPFGLGDLAGCVQFTAMLDSANHRIRDNEGAGETTVVVEVVRADEVLAGEDPVVIKIDVEGEERGVLEGARGILAKSTVLGVIMETFRPFDFQQPDLAAEEAILREFGLLPMAYDPWKRELRPLLDPWEGSQNSIYVRDAARVSSRLKAAEPIKAFGRRI